MTIKYDLPENLKTALDCAVRDYYGKMAKGFKMKDGRQYNNYMSNDDWSSYLDKMNEDHKRQYGMGAGGELKEGKYPPKMASFGSSSRFVYELSKGIEGFIFEERLDTRVGGTANLDGFLPKGCEYTYVEAKMREIYYPSHENQEIKAVYEPVYEEIQTACSEFSYESENTKDDNGEEMKKITFKIRNEPVEFFDLKQLICHFLGITYDVTKHSKKNVRIKFLYLLFNPKKVEGSIDKRYHDKIMNRYKKVSCFINDNIEIIKSIFDAVLEYQVKHHSMEKPHIEFVFKLVDQDSYREEFK